MSFDELERRIAVFREADGTHLDLSFLILRELSASLFSEDVVKRLTSLNLSYNALVTLPERIAELKSLVVLDLSYNGLIALPDSLSDLSSIKSLDLSGNELTQLPDSLFNLRSLTSLDISGNELTELPDRLFDLTSLTSLNVSENELTELPDRLFDLTSLTSLNVSENELAKLPDRLFDLTSLVSLNVSATGLTELPNRIANLTSLTTLNLGSNLLTELPDRLGSMDGLRKLMIYDTGLTGLPDWLSQVTPLQFIDLEGLDLMGEDLSRIWPQIFDLTETNLQGANIRGLDLRETEGLEQEQLEGAIGNASTLIPEGMEYPYHWEGDGEVAEDSLDTPPPGIPPARPAPVRARIEDGRVVLDTSQMPETVMDQADLDLHRKELMRDADHLFSALGNAGGIRRRLAEYRDALGADAISFNELLLGLRGEAFASAVQRAEEELLGDTLGDLEGLVAKHQIFMRHFPKWLAHVAPDAAEELTEEIVEQTKTAFDSILNEMALEEDLFDPQIARLLKSFEEAAESFKGFARNQWRGAYRSLENVLNSLARFAVEFGTRTKDQLLEIGPKRAAQFIVALSGAGLTALIGTMASSFGWLAPVVAYLAKLLT